MAKDFRTNVEINGKLTGNGDTVINAASATSLVVSGNIQAKGPSNDQANVSIGYLAISSNTSGTANTGIGNTALRSNTIGSANVAIGYALYTGSNVNYNVSIGHESMASAITANSNVAIGLSALKNNLSGIENVAIGPNALISTTGNYNVAIGTNSGSSVTTGQYNTFINSKNGVSTGGLSGVVAIGVDNSGNYATGRANNDFILGSSNHNIKIAGTASIVGNTYLGSASINGVAVATSPSIQYSTASLQNISTTAFVKPTGMTGITLKANTLYKYEISINYRVFGTNQIFKSKLVHPNLTLGTAHHVIGTNTTQISYLGIVEKLNTSASTDISTTTSTNSGATELIQRIDGIIQPSADGTFSYEFAPATSSAVVFSNSYIMVNPVTAV